MKIFFIVIIVLSSYRLFAQSNDSIQIVKELKDSLYIVEIENVKGIDKVLHEEPLLIDLIRDLVARKGERKWNVGPGLIDRRNFDSYTTLVEYEFAPIDRFGLEIELPFTFYSPVESATS